MKGVIVTDRGLEEIALADARRLTRCSGNAGLGHAIIDVSSVQDLIKIGYCSQVIKRVMIHISSGDISSGFNNMISSFDLKSVEDVLKNADAFAVRCDRVGDHEFSSLEAEEMFGGKIKEFFPHLKVALNKPKVLLHLAICEGSAVFGLDLAGRDLSKRDYRVFIGPHTLKGTIAAGLLQYAGFSGKGILLDPFCGAGTVCIEAALHSRGVSPHQFSKGFIATHSGVVESIDYDSLCDVKEETGVSIHSFDPQLPHITSAKKNAKIAGIQKAITFSKVDVEWIDLKFEENSVDYIVTYPPHVSKVIPASKIDPIYNELFHQVSHVLKKEGKIALVTHKPDHLITHAQARDFVLESKISVWSGKQEMWFLLFSQSR